jgi:hypothetical protein
MIFFYSFRHCIRLRIEQQTEQVQRFNTSTLRYNRNITTTHTPPARLTTGIQTSPTALVIAVCQFRPFVVKRSQQASDGDQPVDHIILIRSSVPVCVCFSKILSSASFFLKSHRCIHFLSSCGIISEYRLPVRWLPRNSFRRL